MKILLRVLLKPFPGAKRMLRRVYDLLFAKHSVSSHYVSISKADVNHESARLRSSWQADTLPVRQRALVDKQLADYQQGKPIDVFDVLVEALRSISLGERPHSVLEVGCSSGYYSEVLKIKELPYSYTGCDYSPAFIELGKLLYPGTPFYVQDATALGFEDNAYDIVVSGCCLLHIPEYERAIAEAARVAREYAIFHRTPVVTGLPHQYFRKQAYGIETVEIHFNEEQLLSLFDQYGLVIVNTFTLSRESDPDVPGAWRLNRTYLCRKTADAD